MAEKPAFKKVVDTHQDGMNFPKILFSGHGHKMTVIVDILPGVE
jgi:hypothetical protein